MRQAIDFKSKYRIAISEYCSTNDIRSLLEVSSAKARQIKKQVEIECKSKGIVLYSSNKVPTEVLLEVVGKNTEYYYQKMIDEGKAV